jgi:hypothetical protein
LFNAKQWQGLELNLVLTVPVLGPLLVFSGQANFWHQKESSMLILKQEQGEAIAERLLSCVEGN